MIWQEGVAVTVELLALGAGAFLVAQPPYFRIEFGSGFGRALSRLFMVPRHKEGAARRQVARRRQTKT